MLNLVELVADAEECTLAPCAHGSVVVGHACYCHDDEWEEGPRKCPIYRAHGMGDLSKWFAREWDLIELPAYVGGGKPPKMEKRPCMPDDGLGGCPHFVARL